MLFNESGYSGNVLIVRTPSLCHSHHSHWIECVCFLAEFVRVKIVRIHIHTVTIASEYSSPYASSDRHLTLVVDVEKTLDIEIYLSTKQSDPLTSGISKHNRQLVLEDEYIIKNCRSVQFWIIS